MDLNRLLPPGPGNPRNTEGAFVSLKDGRILFVYSKFTGGGGDDDDAVLAARYSRDGGKTWTTEDRIIVENEGGLNVMSPSFLRLADGRIALFYLRKQSLSDCRVYLRYSSDEGQRWTAPALCIDELGYFVLNNDRAVQLKSGRILLPVALHRGADGKYASRGTAMTYASDDSGKTWRRSQTVLEAPPATKAGLQEPGVVELRDGRLLMWIRTQMGHQWVSWSTDQGENWSAPYPSGIVSPLSPASMKRIPKTGDLVMVWNDQPSGKRTPLTIAVSRDDGRTWIHRTNLLDDPDGFYCYTAIHFQGDEILLSFVDGSKTLGGLSRTSIARVPLKALYQVRP